jgi:phosphoserine phosphatase
VLTAEGFSEARLRAWMRDDLRIAAYLEQRFAATADLTVEQVAPELRERLSAERRAGLIADWIADLRRRTPVVELWKNR